MEPSLFLIEFHYVAFLGNVGFLRFLNGIPDTHTFFLISAVAVKRFTVFWGLQILWIGDICIV